MSAPIHTWPMMIPAQTAAPTSVADALTKATWQDLARALAAKAGV